MFNIPSWQHGQIHHPKGINQWDWPNDDNYNTWMTYEGQLTLIIVSGIVWGIALIVLIGVLIYGLLEYSRTPNLHKHYNYHCEICENLDDTNSKKIWTPFASWRLDDFLASVIVGFVGFALVYSIILLVTFLPVMCTIGSYSAPKKLFLTELMNKVSTNVTGIDYIDFSSKDWWVKVAEFIKSNGVGDWDITFKTDLNRFYTWCNIYYGQNLWGIWGVII